MWAPSVLMPLEEGRRHAWCHHPGATVVPCATVTVPGAIIAVPLWCHHCGHRNKHLEQVWTAATGVSCKGWRDKQATKHSIPA